MTGENLEEKSDVEKKGDIPKPSKLPMLVNLCITLVLVIGSTVYFQMKLIWAESNISSLENDLNWLRKELVRSSKSISKRSTPMIIIQQQLVSDATTKALGVEGVILEGGKAHQHIGENVTGRIGPWHLSSEQSQFLNLIKRNMEVKIKLKGLYFIYAQISYITSEGSNSFEIVTYKVNQTRKDHRTLTICSSINNDASLLIDDKSVIEISCYTGVAAFLNSEDRIYLNQVEHNRHINFGKGYTYLGILKMKEEN